jgi:hypothetical protein
MLSLTPTDIPQEFDYQTQKLDGRTVLVTGGTTGTTPPAPAALLAIT